MSWSGRQILVARNYARFYRGRLVPPYRNVGPQKGAGPMLVVTVIDPAPRYEVRDTLHGPDRVDCNLFEAKLRFRQWTGTANLVHGSDNAAEAVRDLMLLLGFDARGYLDAHPGAWDGVVRPLARDLSGAHGWQSAEQLLHALNCSVDYVVLHGAGLDEPAAGEVVELLTESYREMIAVTNARPVQQRIPPHGGRFRVSIGGHERVLGFRLVGDQYFDRDWQRAVLARRQWDRRGFFVPCPADDLETLAYHHLVHGRERPAAERTRLLAMAAALGRTDWSAAVLDDPERAKAALDAILAAGGYRHLRPLDVSVGYDFAMAGQAWPEVQAVVAGLQQQAASWSAAWPAPWRRLTLAPRDRLVRALPWLRKLGRPGRGRRPGPPFKVPTLPAGFDPWGRPPPVTVDRRLA